MRLIDADALRDALGITGTKESCKGCQYNKRFNFACNTDDAPTFAYVCEQIDEAPPIDAVPVIRCNDCKWFGKSGCAILIVDESDKPKEDDFCSWAEGKEE